MADARLRQARRYAGVLLLAVAGSVALAQDAVQDADEPGPAQRRVWTPPEEDRSAFRDIVDYNIFRSDRSAIARRVDEQRNPREPDDDTPRDPVPVIEDAPPDPDAGWLLVGITHDAGGSVAFFEQAETGEQVRLDGPAAVSQGEMTAIGLDAVVYTVDGEQRVIRVGQSLTGMRTTPKATTPDTGGRESAEPRAGGLEDRLRQLREQRAREQGQAPRPATESSDPTEADPDAPAEQPAETTTATPALDRPARDN